MKLAILAFLYRGDFVKNSGVRIGLVHLRMYKFLYWSMFCKFVNLPVTTFSQHMYSAAITGSVET